MVHSSYNFSRFPGFRSIHRPQLGATIAASYIRGTQYNMPYSSGVCCTTLGYVFQRF
ncbi:hypothetical protein AFLA70_894g000112 [Aspergillus flavus AF70]|nr:hypothetical protein AFLA70_894g000112 [Aspergillus flavus AF70]